MDISTLLSMLGNPNLSQAQAQMLLGQLQDFFSQTSGFARTQLDTQTQLSRDQLAQNNAQFQAQLSLQRDQMERLQIPQLEINRQLANMEDEHFKAQLGLSYLTQASQFAASDPFALSDFMRGATKNPGVPVYLQNMMNNVAQGTGGAVGPEAPKAVTLNTLGQAMGGPSAAIGGGAAAGGQGATQVAPGVTLNQQGFGGSLNQFGTTGAGPGATTTAVAPGQSGPTTPENRSFGIGPASQDFGNGPGQGGIDVSGQRGLSTPTTTGFQTGDALRFNFAALTGKAPGSFIQLQDKDTGRVIGQSQVQGTNMPVTMTLLEDMKPNGRYHIFTDYPGEGGATAGIDFSPSELTLDNSPQGQAARQAVVDFWHSPAGNVDNRAYAGNDLFNQVFGQTPTAAASSVGPAAGQTPSTTDTSTPSVGPNGFSQTNPAELAMGFLFNQGADKLAPGTIESLSPEELANLGQGVNHLYGQQAMPSFLEAYRRSRPSQTAAQGSYFAG